MYGVNASCYIRIPFTFAGNRSSIHSMTLRTQYDDGFVAFLNGVEIARRNCVGEPAWNSVASASHGDAEAAVFWYRPKGSETYEVVYGDLTIEDVAEDDLPPDPREPPPDDEGGDQPEE